MSTSPKTYWFMRERRNGFSPNVVVSSTQLSPLSQRQSSSTGVSLYGFFRRQPRLPVSSLVPEHRQSSQVSRTLLCRWLLLTLSSPNIWAHPLSFPTFLSRHWVKSTYYSHYKGQGYQVELFSVHARLFASPNISVCRMVSLA